MDNDVVRGPELVRRPAERHPEGPVLYASGYAGDAVDLSALEGTQMSFLAEPFRLDGIARAVSEARYPAAAR